MCALTSSSTRFRSVAKSWMRPFLEFDVRPSDPIGNRLSMAVGQFEHVVVHVDADDATMRSDDLGSDVADFSAAASEVENGLSRFDPFRRITTSVIALDQFRRQYVEIFVLVIDRTAQRYFRFSRSIGVSTGVRNLRRYERLEW